MTEQVGSDAVVGFGVIGANSFVANAAVLPAIAAAANARLVATSSRSGDVPEAWASTDVGSYEAVIAHPAADAIYIPLPNSMHQEWTERAAAAGKHVLCEKPLASDSATAQAMADACAEADVVLAEAWMTPFSDRYRHLVDRLRHQAIGDVQRIDTRFSFTIGPGNERNYRWDPDQGGGALLDVGIYCLGPIVDLFDADPSGIAARSQLTERGVDAALSAELSWDDGRSASIQCSFVGDEAQTLHVSATAGTAEVTDETFTGGGRDLADAFVGVDGERTTHRFASANDPYQTMIEAFADAVTGRAEWPRPPGRSIEMLQLIERIRDAATN